MSVRAIVLTSLVSTFSLAPPVPFPSRPEVPGTQGPNSRWRRDLRPDVFRRGPSRKEADAKPAPRTVRPKMERRGAALGAVLRPPEPKDSTWRKHETVMDHAGGRPGAGAGEAGGGGGAAGAAARRGRGPAPRAGRPGAGAAGA